MSGKKVAIWISDRIESEIKARGDNRSGTITRDLERLYGLYRRVLRRIRFTTQEAIAICEVVNGTLYDATTASMLWAAVEDADRLNNLGTRHGIDTKALVEKLRSLDDATALAVVDAAERALRYQGDIKEAVIAVGLADTARPGETMDGSE